MQVYGNLSDLPGKIECIVWVANIMTKVLLRILQVVGFGMCGSIPAFHF